MCVKDQHVVITGGGSGVGAELARCYSELGARVSILGRRLQPLQDVASPIDALATVCDVTDAKSVKRALDACRDENGAIGIAVANAGAAPSMPFSRVTPLDFQQTLSVNLEGVFNLWQKALPDMKQAGWGRLIAIASTAGLKGYPYVSGYCAAKHGVVGLTRALALELATTGVTVNAVCPGFVETPMLERSITNIMEKTGMSEELAAKSLFTNNPQKRFLQTEEVANAVLWLSSKATGAVNGHTLSLAGGEI